MEVKISAKNLTVSERFRDYVDERAAKVDHLLHKATEVVVKITRIEHKHSGTEDQVELTVYGGGNIIRAEAHAQDKFAAFDVAYAKLTERLRRASDKRKVHRGLHGSHGVSELTATDFAELDITPVDGDLLLGIVPEPSPVEVDLGESPIAIRRKDFHAEPMTQEQAIEAMELLGHDFFLFHDEQTDKVSVLYKRRGWNYGVITLV
ncbi:MAG: ribosome-associated translation inhibitor RaiA [Rhodoluna sp.]|nr:ribosome-associated translation inhibitor RaiA [Rhodoluna sp.]